MDQHRQERPFTAIVDPLLLPVLDSVHDGWGLPPNAMGGSHAPVYSIPARNLQVWEWHSQRVGVACPPPRDGDYMPFTENHHLGPLAPLPSFPEYEWDAAPLSLESPCDVKLHEESYRRQPLLSYGDLPPPGKCAQWNSNAEPLENKVRNPPPIEKMPEMVSDVPLRTPELNAAILGAVSKTDSLAAIPTVASERPATHNPLAPNIEECRSHVRRKQGQGKAQKQRQMFVCSYCGKKIDTKCKLQRHELIHTGEKPFKCELCPSGFNQRGSLKGHSRIHARKYLMTQRPSVEDSLKYRVNGYTLEGLDYLYWAPR